MTCIEALHFYHFWIGWAERFAFSFSPNRWIHNLSELFCAHQRNSQCGKNLNFNKKFSSIHLRSYSYGNHGFEIDNFFLNFNSMPKDTGLIIKAIENELLFDQIQQHKVCRSVYKWDEFNASNITRARCKIKMMVDNQIVIEQWAINWLSFVITSSKCCLSPNMIGELATNLICGPHVPEFNNVWTVSVLYQ